MSSKPRTNKKQKGKKLMVAMGDTVKITKGRIGLIRFIGKTQFGLGEWIGIELYNELIRTRHNGAVLGKRYFRCPPRRGVFIRRSLIKENIAVLAIQPLLKKLRAKEKKLKQQRKKQRSKQQKAKKMKNEEKREAKRLKIEAKYGKANAKPASIFAKIETVKQKKVKKLQARSQTPTATSTRRSRSKSPRVDRRSKSPIVPHTVNTASFQIAKPRKQRARTPTDPTNDKHKHKKRSKTPNDKHKKIQKNGKKKKKKRAKYESDSENEEKEAFPDIPNVIFAAEPMVARQVKVKYKEQDKKSKSYSTDLTHKFKASKKRDTKRAASKKDVIHIKKHEMKKSKTLPPRKPEDDDEEEDDEDDDDSLSASKESIDIPIFQQDSLLNRSGTEPQIRIVDEEIPSEMNITKKKISIDDNDGTIDSEDSSLNEDEDEEDEDDRELKKELEEDFEENFEKFHRNVLDEYTHTIDDIETGRKILANKVVADTRRRMSHDQDVHHADVGGRQRAGGLAKYRQRRPKIMNNFQRSKQPNAMLALPRKASKQFDVARSRRGSSFVDKYNLNDTLFFDGDEENEEVQNADIADIEEEKEEEEEEDGDEDEEEADLKIDIVDVKDTILPKGGDATPIIVEEEEEEDEEEDDTEVEKDPLLGTIEDIIDEETQSEYEEEEFKIFDLEEETAKVKKVIFYVELSEFIEWKSCQKDNGLKISKVKSNEYGKALFVETGVESEWIVTHINDSDITDKTKEDIGREIEKCNLENGYNVVFVKAEDVDIDNKSDDDTNNKTENNKMVDEEIHELNNLKPSVYMKKKKQSE